MFEQSQESQRSFGLVRNLVTEALDEAPVTLHLTEEQIESLTGNLAFLPFPEFDEVSGIIAKFLASTGQSTEEATANANAVTGKIVDGMNTLDLSL